MFNDPMGQYQADRARREAAEHWASGQRAAAEYAHPGGFRHGLGAMLRGAAERLDGHAVAEQRSREELC